MNPVAIAVAGAGSIGRKHVAALSRSTTARLAAIVDPSPAAEALAAEHGVPHLTALTDLVGREAGQDRAGQDRGADRAETDRAGSGLPGPGLIAVDGVILATPTQLHLPQALDCVARGLPALVEKPVTATAAEGAELAAAADAAGVPVLVGHHRRHNPRIAAARALIAEGRLGRVVSVHASVLLCKPDDYFAPDWRRQPGAGPVLTNLIHEIDTMRHLLGEVVAVEAMSSNAIRGFAVEDTAAVILRFASGALGTVAVSDAAAAPWSWELTASENPDYPPTGQSCLMISGTHAALELPNLRLWRHQGPRGWFTPLEPELIPTLDRDPLDRQIDHFAAVIRGEAAPLVGVADAAASVAVVDAILAAAARQQPNPSERTSP